MSPGVGIGENSMVVGEYVVEKIVLYVLACQWLCIISFDRQGFTTEITNPGAEMVIRNDSHEEI